MIDGRKRWLLPLAACLLALAGCQQEMAEQPSLHPLERCEFFANQSASRMPVAGTVARGELCGDRAFCTGLQPTAAVKDDETGLTVARTDLAERPYVKQFPVPVTRELVAQGRERYTVFCSVCHGQTGAGDGIVVQRGFTAPPTYHSDRLRAAPVGYFFDVITRGYGSMPDYGPQIPPAHRWAIVAYLRALQLSQHAPLDDLPDHVKKAVLSDLEGRRGDKQR